MAGIDNAGITTRDTTNLRGQTLGQYPIVITPFEYATSCGSQWYQPWPDVETSGSQSQYFSVGPYGTYFTACQPDGKLAFSPGVCPSGYSMATITEYNDGKGGSSRLWGAMCCEKGFTFQLTDGSGLCASTLDLDETIRVYRSTIITTLSTWSNIVITGNEITYDADQNTAVVTGGTKLAQPPYIYWQSSDLSLFEPSYASVLASRLKIPFTPTGTPANTTVATEAPDSSASLASPFLTASPASTSPNIPLPTTSPSPTLLHPSNSHLSTGIIAGISVAGALAFAIAALLIYKCIRRRRGTTSDTHHHEEATIEPAIAGLAELQHHDHKEKHEGQHVENTISELPSPHVERGEKYAGEIGGFGVSELPSPQPQHGQKYEREGEVHGISELPSPVAKMNGSTVWEGK